MLLNYKLKLFILALFSLKSHPEVSENNLSIAMINGQTPVTRTKTSWGTTSGGFSNSPTKVWLQSNLIPSVILIYVFKFTLFFWYSHFSSPPCKRMCWIRMKCSSSKRYLLLTFVNIFRIVKRQCQKGFALFCKYVIH